MLFELEPETYINLSEIEQVHIVNDKNAPFGAVSKECLLKFKSGNVLTITMSQWERILPLLTGTPAAAVASVLPNDVIRAYRELRACEADIDTYVSTETVDNIRRDLVDLLGTFIPDEEIADHDTL